jgi:hypothetical protein
MVSWQKILSGQRAKDNPTKERRTGKNQKGSRQTLSKSVMELKGGMGFFHLMPWR